MDAIREILKFAHVNQWPPTLLTATRIVVILILGWVLLRIGKKLILTFRVYMSGRAVSPEDVKRIETLGRVFRYVASVVITLVAGMLILSELGISIAPILGAAGVVGLAVGFGAQSLIKDYFSGFFMLLEDQVHQGDVVEVAGKSGLVEEVTLRYIRLRDFESNVHFVPNGLITTVTNRSRGYAHSVINVGVGYSEDVDEALEAMRDVGAQMRRSEDFGPKILEDIEIVGVEDLGDSAVKLVCRIKVQPLEQWAVRREFLRRLKQAFDARGIEIPYPRLTLYTGHTNDDAAALPQVVAEAHGATPSPPERIAKR